MDGCDAVAGCGEGGGMGRCTEKSASVHVRAGGRVGVSHYHNTAYVLPVVGVGGLVYVG